MRKLLVLLTCLLVALPTFARAQEQRGFKIKDKSGNEVGLYENSYALLIGVSEYTSGWPKLYGVKKDIPIVKSALEKHGFTVIVVEDPTYKQLQEAFVSFLNKYGQKPNDRLLLYFSGHGHTMKLAYGGEMGYIVPVDAPNPNLDSAGFFGSAAASASFCIISSLLISPIMPTASARQRAQCFICGRYSPVAF